MLPPPPKTFAFPHNLAAHSTGHESTRHGWLRELSSLLSTSNRGAWSWGRWWQRAARNSALNVPHLRVGCVPQVPAGGHDSMAITTLGAVRAVLDAKQMVWVELHGGRVRVSASWGSLFQCAWAAALRKKNV